MPDSGRREYEWATSNMPLIQKIINKFNGKNVLENYSLGLCLHITKETSVLVMALKKLGAQVFLCSANPLSVQNQIADFLKDNGIIVYATHNQQIDKFNLNMRSVLDAKPDIITDDGGELHKKALNTGHKVIGGTEETTTGVNRLMQWQKRELLTYPIITVNQSKTKFLFDNRYGTGQSVIEGILRITGLLIASKRIVVCGYGWVGKGVAHCARGMGAKVIVTETDPLKALEAFFDGFEVARLDEIIHVADIFITCTGQMKVIGGNHIEKMKDGVILCNAGHFDVEIDKKYLDSLDEQPLSIRNHLKCYKNKRNNNKIFLLAEGRVVNLIGAEGNAPQVMSMSFANQLLSIIYISKYHDKMQNKIYPVPERIEKNVASLALESFGLTIDKLTKEQKNYFQN